VNKRRICTTSVLAVALALMLHGSSFSAGSLTVDPAVLSGFSLPVPESKAAKSYLGIRGKEVFTLSQVAAKTLVVQIFSMYCPHCQADAPEVNKLYQLIQENPRLKDKVKLIGIGTGNTVFEVNLFRKKFHVPFPLFPDENLDVQKACSERIRTPLFIVAKPEGPRGLKILHVHVGKITNAETFLKTITHPKNR
jgi:thiol-disulfide isomerase/thioredoxin